MESDTYRRSQNFAPLHGREELQSCGPLRRQSPNYLFIGKKKQTQRTYYGLTYSNYKIVNFN